MNQNVYDADGTQDAAEDEKQLSRVKDWISASHLETVEIIDILANFPDISVVSIDNKTEWNILWLQSIYSHHFVANTAGTYRR